MDNFDELSLHTSGSFTVEKCFDACNLTTVREAIANESLDVKADLSKQKQGPFLIRKLDIDGYLVWTHTCVLLHILPRPTFGVKRHRKEQARYKEEPICWLKEEETEKERNW
ncbi:hypothetical protein N665_0242s0009 [Sinapis alba]|nr:hypothetical protein N665_0242s0009 [Sinapis alba]